MEIRSNGFPEKLGLTVHSPGLFECKIITGTAKGLTYLHEEFEPKVDRRDIKSSNILLDQRWNPQGSDGNIWICSSGKCTGMLNERSDVYSFGILIMDIISGRSLVGYNRPPGEVNLVEWLKTMVTKRDAKGVLDPRLAEKPSTRALKRALLIALRCIDPNAKKRPKMWYVVHMLEADEFLFREADEFLFRDERSSRLDHTYSHREIFRDRLMDKRVNESGEQLRKRCPK